MYQLLIGYHIVINRPFYYTGIVSQLIKLHNSYCKYTNLNIWYLAQWTVHPPCIREVLDSNPIRRLISLDRAIPENLKSL